MTMEICGNLGLPIAMVPCLHQSNAYIKRKLQLLKLDEELSLSVGEDELDYEIEQADIVRERAELAIIGLDEALTKISKIVESV